MAGILFEDIFDVKDIDPEGKKFDRGELGPGPLLPVPPLPLALAPPRVPSPRSAPLPQGFPSPAAVPPTPLRTFCALHPPPHRVPLPACVHFHHLPGSGIHPKPSIPNPSENGSGASLGWEDDPVPPPALGDFLCPGS